MSKSCVGGIAFLSLLFISTYVFCFLSFRVCVLKINIQLKVRRVLLASIFFWSLPLGVLLEKKTTTTRGVLSSKILMFMLSESREELSGRFSIEFNIPTGEMVTCSIFLHAVQEGVETGRFHGFKRC